MSTPHGESTSSHQIYSSRRPLMDESVATSSTDDSSVVQRSHKLEEMRARVEAQLENLVRGSEGNFESLRQQVAELRTSHRHPDSPVTASQQKEITYLPSPPVKQGSGGLYSSAVSTQASHTSETISTALSMPGPPSYASLPGAPTSSTTSSSVEAYETSPTTQTSLSLASVSLEAPSLASGGSSLTGQQGSAEQSAEVPHAPPAIMEVSNLRIRDPYGDGGVYTGTVKHSKPHGSGVMAYDDGRTYSGTWRDGHWHGQGCVVFSNGDQYEGSYEKDQRHGFGIYSWSDGRRYEGEFKNDQRDGLGEYRWPDNSMYKGFFKNGHREGEGTYIFATGDCYTGEWKRGKYHGLGECVWASGRSYKGEWYEGKAHGYGIETRADGTLRHDGQWNQDRPVRDSKS